LKNEANQLSKIYPSSNLSANKCGKPFNNVLPFPAREKEVLNCASKVSPGLRLTDKPPIQKHPEILVKIEYPSIKAFVLKKANGEMFTNVNPESELRKFVLPNEPTVKSENSTGEDSNNSENPISFNQSTLSINSAVNKDRRLSDSELNLNTEVQTEVMDLKKETTSTPKEFTPDIQYNAVSNFIISNEEVLFLMIISKKRDQR
jgi:hypothetical protein